MEERTDFLKAVVQACLEGKEKRTKIPIGVSNRHVHLNRADMDAIFGKGSELTFHKELSQKGYFAAKETVLVAGPKGSLQRVRLLGPLREHTQVELLRSDAHVLGIELEGRHSGHLKETAPVTIIGPCGTIENRTGVMIALRHIHMSYSDAALFGLHNGDEVSVLTSGERSVEFKNVLIRIGDFMTEFHIDRDEANGAGVNEGDIATMIV